MLRYISNKFVRWSAHAARRFLGYTALEEQRLAIGDLKQKITKIDETVGGVSLKLTLIDDLEATLKNLHQILEDIPRKNLEVSLELQKQFAERFDEITVAILYNMSEKIDSLNAKLEGTHSSTLTNMNEKIDNLLNIENAFAEDRKDAAQQTNLIVQRLDQIPWPVFYSLSEKIDILLHDRDFAAQVNKHVSQETNRLDGYINYHFEILKDDIIQIIPDSIALALKTPLSSMLTMLEGDISDRAFLPIKADPNLLYSAYELDAIVEYGAYDVIVPTSEIGLLTYIKRHGLHAIEPAVRAALRRHIRAGDVVIDGGVNLGMHSLTMADAVGITGKLIGFEPLSHMAVVAQKTLRLNGFEARSRIVTAAIADQIGEISFNVSRHSPVSSIFPLFDCDSHSSIVPCTTIDAQVAPGSRVDFVKLDIEGAEPLAWKGMSRVLAENPNICVLMEWSASHFSRSGHDMDVFMLNIKKLGFKAWLLRDDLPDEPEMLDESIIFELEGKNILLSRNNIAGT